MNGRLLRLLGAALGIVIVSLALAGGGGAAGSKPRVLAIRFGPDLEINPVTQDYFTHELAKAASNHYDAAVILLDTPGGLSTSMKTMYTAELNAKLPVIVYVSPDGARAASAGVWISQAADVLAMAPTTNIGSSTPIDSSGANLGSDLRRKVINDSAASLTALAATHHRNTTWPGKAVRVASNLTSRQALNMHVVDLLAPSLPALLDKLDGYKTKDAQRPYTLHLAGAQIDTVGPGFFTRLLNTLIDPNIISLLFLAGIAGIGFEIFHPGIVLPGALGAVSLLTALFGFSVLPISWAGLFAHPPGSRAARRGRARRDARGADRLRADQPRGRNADALPQRARAVPHVAPARALDHPRAGRLLGVRARQGGTGAPPSGHGRAAARARRRRSRARAGTGLRRWASSGTPIATTAASSSRASTSRSKSSTGSNSRCARVG